MAQTTDPLWLKAQAHVVAIKNLVASEVTTHSESMNGDGEDKSTSDVKTRLTGWKDGEPVRTVESFIETQKTSLDATQFDLDLANHPEKAMAGILTVHVHGNLAHRSCVWSPKHINTPLIYGPRP
jgi:D-tyrosyl-tRNA(Tyr) deacylase